jgi:hypothetical protein
MFGFKKTVDSITGGLASIVRELEAHVSDQTSEAQKAADAAAKAEAAKAEAVAEITKATTIRNKIAALLGA